MSDAPYGMTPIATGTTDGIKWATVRAPIYGAVNGYVCVPDDHPWHGLDYNDIDVQAHGGLTYASRGWIGFDTLHLGDVWPGFGSLDTNDRYTKHWTAEMVATEAQALARRVAKAYQP